MRRVAVKWSCIHERQPEIGRIADCEIARQGAELAWSPSVVAVAHFASA